jgi:hypothetical protein
MDDLSPIIIGAALGLTGVLLGLLWTIRQYYLARRHRIEEILRAERQARYVEFIALADELLLALESVWHGLKLKVERLKNADANLADAEGSNISADLLRGYVQGRESAGDALKNALSAMDDERLRGSAEKVRASRILLELLASERVARDALFVQQKLVELLGALENAERVARAPSIIAEIRERRMELLEHAKRDVQLVRRGSYP